MAFLLFVIMQFHIRAFFIIAFSVLLSLTLWVSPSPIHAKEIEEDTDNDGYGIVKNHGGFINVYSEKGKGATFNIYLPASEKEAKEQSSLTKKLEIQTGHGSILIVDDESMIVEVGKAMLEKLGYRVFVAQSGQEALDVYLQHRQKINLVILDMIMPGMGGGQTYDRLREIDERVKVVLSSGYTIDGQAKEIMKRGCSGFIQKPFSIEVLSRKLREVLSYSEKG